MTSLTDLLSHGAAHAWLFVPSAVLLGALHGLEPGHSKTMMAAFIVAVRGTVRQAVLLGLAATLSHTAVVWIVALGGVYLFRDFGPAGAEPYLQFASGLLILAIAGWMLWRTRREQRHEHDHHHEGEDGHWRRHDDDDDHDHHTQGGGHRHDHHGHRDRRVRSHAAGDLDHALELTDGGYQDAHERQHAEDIRRRFDGRDVTTGQIVAFGLTGGLIPCPGALTVLLLCLQLKRIALGSVLVLCFSVGLALTMVASGVIAALSVRYAERRFGGFGTLVRRAPYASGVVIMCVGAYLTLRGWQSLPLAG